MMKTSLSEKQEFARAKVCHPLDGLNSIEELEQRVKELSPVVGLFKIGKESYTRFGPSCVSIVKKHGSQVFLDLKYHDIPNTVKGAAKAAAELGVFMFNVHCSGGLEMMKAAVAGARQAGTTAPKVVGVTVLTSIDQDIMNKEIGIPGKVDEEVLKLALLAEQAGLDGIVCSAADLDYIKDKLPESFLYVTPGIHGPAGGGSDQKRVLTPGLALQKGASILVIGRAISSPKSAEERLNAGIEVLKDMEKHMF